MNENQWLQTLVALPHILFFGIGWWACQFYYGIKSIHRT